MSDANAPPNRNPIVCVAFDSAVSITMDKSFPVGETYDTTDPDPSAKSLQAPLSANRQPGCTNCVVCATIQTV